MKVNWGSRGPGSRTPVNPGGHLSLELTGVRQLSGSTPSREVEGWREGGQVMITLILYTGEWWWGLGPGCDNDTQITHRKRGESKMLRRRLSSAFTSQPPAVVQMKMICRALNGQIAETLGLLRGI